MPARGTIELAEAGLIGRCGLISQVQDLHVYPGNPRLFFCAATLAGRENTGSIHLPQHYNAVGFTQEEAAAAAIGEAIERHCCASWAWDNLIYCSQRELGNERAIGMDRFAMYRDDVYEAPPFPVVRWTPDSPCHWVKAKSLLREGVYYLPATMVLSAGHELCQAGSELFAECVTSGGACHTDPDMAVLSGLWEVIERDAFMITWLRRINPCRIDYAADPELGKIYEQCFAGSNLHVSAFEITLDIRVPTMLVVGSGTTPAGQFWAVGAAARLSKRDAALKALKEAAQCAAWARELVATQPDWRPAANFINVIAFEHHVRLFCEPEMGRHLSFILDTPCRADLDAHFSCLDTWESLRRSVDYVRQRGLEPFVVDLTSPEIAELGFTVVKVLVPGMVPLTAVHAMPALAARRLVEVPEYVGRPHFTGPEFNPIPHPFP
jgi:ribosomal protein S12 methylthiotransferase accessory factor